MIIQIFLVVFLLFAVSRVIIQLKQNKLTFRSFLFWGTVFAAAILGVVDPSITTRLARFLGIGRGADLVIYFSIVILFYLIFRLTITLEELRNDLTIIIRELALKNAKRKKA